MRRRTMRLGSRMASKACGSACPATHGAAVAGWVAAAFSCQEAFRELGADMYEISVPSLARASIINNAIVPSETAAPPPRLGGNLVQGGAIPVWRGRWRAARDGESGARDRLRPRLAQRRCAGGRPRGGFSQPRADLLLTPTVAVAATRPAKDDRARQAEFDPINVVIHFLCGFQP